MASIIDSPASPPFRPNDIIRFEYPKLNDLRHHAPSYAPRIVQVKEIRDTCRKALNPATIAHNPTVTRGRWLITGQCLELNRERSFYFESMRHVAKRTFLTLGLFDPIDPSPDRQPIKTYGIFAPCAEDRIYLAKIITDFNGLSDAVYSLGVFPFDQVEGGVSRCRSA